MIRLITIDDFIDTYSKIKQRGMSFITSKFQFNDLMRAKSAFNHHSIEASNWWIIPKIKQRWNYLVTGNKNISFEEFTVNNFLKNKHGLKMLSFGSGNCKSELKFASFPTFDYILCTDISEIPLKQAKNIAKQKKLKNIEFKVQDANKFSGKKKHYDIVYFKASLHHFKNIELFVKLIHGILKNKGLLIIDEYVGPNRLQFPKEQIKSINEAIKLIPKKYKKRFKLNLIKNKIYGGSGLLRMIIADPSECVESESILPNIHKHFKTVYEADYGGNILMTVLKDISHNFIEMDSEKENILNSLFEFENHYLKTHSSDFVFGIYQK